MNRKLIIRILGAILCIESIAMMPAFLISLIYRDGDTQSMAISILITALCGSIMLFALHTDKNTHLRLKEGYIVVALGWILMSLFGCVPFMLSGVLPALKKLSLKQYPDLSPPALLL